MGDLFVLGFAQLHASRLLPSEGQEELPQFEERARRRQLRRYLPPRYYVGRAAPRSRPNSTKASGPRPSRPFRSRETDAHARLWQLRPGVATRRAILGLFLFCAGTAAASGGKAAGSAAKESGRPKVPSLGSFRDLSQGKHRFLVVSLLSPFCARNLKRGRKEKRL